MEHHYIIFCRVLSGFGYYNRIFHLPVLYTTLDKIFHPCHNIWLFWIPSSLFPLLRLPNSQSESERAERCQIHSYDCVYHDHCSCSYTYYIVCLVELHQHICKCLFHWNMGDRHCNTRSYVHPKGIIIVIMSYYYQSRSVYGNNNRIL